MKKTSSDGTTRDFAMYAKNSGGKTVLVSTDDYDVLDPTGEQIDFAIDELGNDVVFYEEEC